MSSEMCNELSPGSPHPRTFSQREKGDSCSGRLCTPQGDRSVLIEPPSDCVGQLVDENRRLRDQHDYDVQGRSLSNLSQAARAELLSAARCWTSAYRDVATDLNDRSETIFLAGHQPQMFHPGVWFKNFALGELACRNRATAVNLIVDTDVSAGASIQVPTGTIHDPQAVPMAFDCEEPRIPYEERRIEDRRQFADFGSQVVEKIASLVVEPLMAQYWPMVCARSRETDNLGACLAQARHQLEAAWGLDTLEVPESRLCSGEAFHWFAAHLFARSAEFRAIHNQAVIEYRREHRIRGTSHPMPELAEKEDWQEVPFWIWTAEEPRRRRLFARSAGGETVLTDRASWQARLPLRSDGDAGRAAAQLMDLERGSVRIRSRALTTTLWARLVLGDLFIHGIGGAKYDQVTDRIIGRFFRRSAPAFMVVSATLLLPIERAGVNEADARAVSQDLRGLTYHPERYLDGADETALRLIAEKQRWIGVEPTPDNAKQRCRAIREINAALQSRLIERRQQMSDRQTQIQQKLRAEQVLASREYAFSLYPETTVRNFFGQLLHKMT